MGRNLYHSAEGSHWTKKNHKYIRKEGNRYIYPEDLQKADNRSSYKTGAMKQNSYSNARYAGDRSSIPAPGTVRMRTTGKNKVSMDYPKEYLEAKKSNVRGATNQSIFEEDTNNIRQRRAETKKSLVNSQGSKNYKQLGQQRANREAAKNGVKEIYRMDDGSSWREYGFSDQEFAKGNGQNKIRKMRQKKALNKQGSKNRQQEAKEFKEYQDWEREDRKSRDRKSKLMTNSNRYKTSGSGLTEQQKKNRQDAANGNGPSYSGPMRFTTAKLSPKEQKRMDYLNDQALVKQAAHIWGVDRNQDAAKAASASYSKSSKARLNRKNTMNSQGSFQKGSQEYAKVNAPVGKKRAQRLADEKKVREKQKNALNNQGLRSNTQEYAKHQGKQAEDRREYNKAKRKLEGWQTEQEFLVNNASNKLKKQGYFTIKNGKTVFVPSDEVTMKKVSKGRRIVDKIKNKFSKKK